MFYSDSPFIDGQMQMKRRVVVSEKEEDGSLYTGVAFPESYLESGRLKIHRKGYEELNFTGTVDTVLQTIVEFDVKNYKVLNLLVTHKGGNSTKLKDFLIDVALIYPDDFPDYQDVWEDSSNFTELIKKTRFSSSELPNPGKSWIQLNVEDFAALRVQATTESGEGELEFRGYALLL